MSTIFNLGQRKDQIQSIFNYIWQPFLISDAFIDSDISLFFSFILLSESPTLCDIIGFFIIFF